MKNFDRKWFLIYGIFLIVVGVVGFASNPEKAKTALISGGLFGALSLVTWVLLGRGMNWALRAGTIMVSFLALVFTWRASVGWYAVTQGQSEKLVAAALISSMWLASVALLLRIRKS